MQSGAAGAIKFDAGQVDTDLAKRKIRLFVDVPQT
jgi:hypothetical protein